MTKKATKKATTSTSTTTSATSTDQLRAALAGASTADLASLLAEGCDQEALEKSRASARVSMVMTLEAITDPTKVEVSRRTKLHARKESAWLKRQTLAQDIADGVSATLAKLDHIASLPAATQARLASPPPKAKMAPADKTVPVETPVEAPVEAPATAS